MEFVRQIFQKMSRYCKWATARYLDRLVNRVFWKVMYIQWMTIWMQRELSVLSRKYLNLIFFFCDGVDAFILLSWLFVSTLFAKSSTLNVGCTLFAYKIWNQLFWKHCTSLLYNDNHQENMLYWIKYTYSCMLSKK